MLHSRIDQAPKSLGRQLILYRRFGTLHHYDHTVFIIRCPFVCDFHYAAIATKDLRRESLDWRLYQQLEVEIMPLASGWSPGQALTLNPAWLPVLAEMETHLKHFGTCMQIGFGIFLAFIILSIIVRLFPIDRRCAISRINADLFTYCHCSCPTVTRSFQRVFAFDVLPQFPCE